MSSLTGVRRVVIPVEHEGFRFDSDAVPHGARLWTNLLGLMCTHAWLEQRNREIRDLPNGERAIMAAPEDYEAAYEVFRETCERSVVNLSGTHRKILNAVYGLTNRAERREGWEVMFAAAGGVSQRDIAQQAGVAQSTVAANKAFLVKSAKLLWEPEGGGLALVKDAEPSSWEEGDALDGFPRPEEVRAWWSEDPSPPHPPDPPDRADHHPDGAERPRDQGANGDRRPADRVQEATDRPRPGDHGAADDREVDGDDRQAADRVNGLSKANNPTTGEVIGMIGGFEDRRKEKVGHDPKRIAELVASIRKRVAQDPGVLRLAQHHTVWGLRFAAGRLFWSPYGLSPTDFTEQEAQEALKILLEEEQGTRKAVSVPAEAR